MKTMSVVMVAGLCAVVCGSVGWKIGARQSVPLQSSAQTQRIVASDQDL